MSLVDQISDIYVPTAAGRLHYHRDPGERLFYLVESPDVLQKAAAHLVARQKPVDREAEGKRFRSFMRWFGR